MIAKPVPRSIYHVAYRKVVMYLVGFIDSLQSKSLPDSIIFPDLDDTTWRGSGA